jgi:hypothetical protein
MEPAEAINLVEVVLRGLVRLVLGDAWMQILVSTSPSWRRSE